MTNTIRKTLLPYLEQSVKEFYNLSKEELIKEIENCSKNTCNEWEKRKDIKSFYEETKSYIFGLIGFNTLERIKTVTYPIKGTSNANILDFGAGIGELGMYFTEYNKVYYYDLECKSKEFAKFVSKKTKRPMIFIDNEEDVYKKKYDLIILMDVLEHLENPLEITKKLINCINENGYLLTNGLSFVVKKEIPMHLPQNKPLNEHLITLLLENFSLNFFHCTDDEPIYLWRKKK